MHLFEGLSKNRHDAAEARSEGTEMAEAFQKLRKLIREGSGDTWAWREVNSQIALRMKLAESERRRLVELSQTITVEQALLLIGQLTGIINTEVKDPKERAAIARQFRAITDDQGSESRHSMR